jgi:hypothetical protein
LLAEEAATRSDPYEDGTTVEIVRDQGGNLIIKARTGTV